MDILDFFWTFYLNHLSPVWGYFYTNLYAELRIVIFEAWRFVIRHINFRRIKIRPFSPAKILPNYESAVFIAKKMKFLKNFAKEYNISSTFTHISDWIKNYIFQKWKIFEERAWNMGENNREHNCLHFNSNWAHVLKILKNGQRTK